MASQKPVVNFHIDEKLLQRIDDYRYKNRFPTRAAAIKHLLEVALDAEEGK